jgi:hypothetical protein
MVNNLEAMRRAIEGAGIRLVFREDGGAAGIEAIPANPAN